MNRVYSMDLEKDIESGIRFSRLLNRHKIKGEFYITGGMVREHPGECREIAEKHIIGGHGFKHENFAKLGGREQVNLVEKTIEVFLEGKITMKGWRFPMLSFNNAGLNILAEKKVFDSSVNSALWAKWGQLFFLRNWAKNLLQGNVFFPERISGALDERTWDAVDLDRERFFEGKGRLILHCYQFKEYERELSEFLEKEGRG